MGERPYDLALALALAEQADALTMPRFGAVELHVDTKPDLTPVTDADRSVESALREVLSPQRPDDAVVGEEFGGTTEFVGRQWVIDPIDGTKNFVRGVPHVGDADRPALRRRAGGRSGQRTRAAPAIVGRDGPGGARGGPHPRRTVSVEGEFQNCHRDHQNSRSALGGSAGVGAQAIGPGDGGQVAR
jgi:hypothetical protein